MNKLRLLYQYLLGAIARPLGFNDRLSQFCDHCGRTKWSVRWWDETNKVWESVAGNVNDRHHGCFCPDCFTILARKKGIWLVWKPTVEPDPVSPEQLAEPIAERKP
jgi:hypothetical protein